jgi:hypothetical protein
MAMQSVVKINLQSLSILQLNGVIVLVSSVLRESALVLERPRDTGGEARLLNCLQRWLEILLTNDEIDISQHSLGGAMVKTGEGGDSLEGQYLNPPYL